MNKQVSLAWVFISNAENLSGIKRKNVHLLMHDGLPSGRETRVSSKLMNKQVNVKKKNKQAKIMQNNLFGKS